MTLQRDISCEFKNVMFDFNVNERYKLEFILKVLTKVTMVYMKVGTKNLILLVSAPVRAQGIGYNLRLS